MNRPHDAWQLAMQCADCDGQPPAGYACLACGAALDGSRYAANIAADLTAWTSLLGFATRKSYGTPAPKRSATVSGTFPPGSPATPANTLND